MEQTFPKPKLRVGNSDIVKKQINKLEYHHLMDEINHLKPSTQVIKESNAILNKNQTEFQVFHKNNAEFKSNSIQKFSKDIEIDSEEEEYDPWKPNDYNKIITDKRTNSSKNIEKSINFQTIDLEMKGIIKEEYSSELKEEDYELIYGKKEKSNQDSKLMRMMEKSGWTFGSRLGKNEQGIETPLEAQKINDSMAKISFSSADFSQFFSPEFRAKKELENLSQYH